MWLGSIFFYRVLNPRTEHLVKYPPSPLTRTFTPDCSSKNNDLARCMILMCWDTDFYSSHKIAIKMTCVDPVLYIPNALMAVLKLWSPLSISITYSPQSVALVQREGQLCVVTRILIFLPISVSLCGILGWGMGATSSNFRWKYGPIGLRFDQNGRVKLI